MARLNMITRSKTRNSISSNPEKSQMSSESSAPRSGPKRQAKTKTGDHKAQAQQNQSGQVMSNEVYDACVEGEHLKSSYQ